MAGLHRIASDIITPVRIRMGSIGKSKDYKSPWCLLKQRHIGAFGQMITREYEKQNQN